MSKPIVAVVGRPNVGKSTLFNKLCGQRLAIVEDTPGITRDRIFANCEWNGHDFLLVDTGGIEPKATEGILAHMREQAQIAIDTADCIIMVVDVRDGLTAADEDVAHMLRGMLKGTLCRMGQLFSPQESRSTNVATFLALLELIRAGRVRLDETGTLTMDRARRPRNKQNQPTGKEAAADADHTAQ